MHFYINVTNHITNGALDDGVALVQTPEVTITGRAPGGLTQVRKQNSQGRVFQFGNAVVVTLVNLVIAGGKVSTHSNGAGMLIVSLEHKARGPT